MKTYLFSLVIILTGIIPSLIPVPSTNDSFEATVYKIAQAFRDKDPETLNGLIHPDLGLTIVYRPGVLDTYIKVMSIDLENPRPYNMPEFEGLDLTELSYAVLPTYSCDDYTWNKNGFFCDTTQTDRLVSKTARSINFQEIGHITAEEIAAIESREENSRKVVLAQKETAHASDLMFSLTLIEGQWFFSVLDLVTSDCDL